jgi:hypothetical protein
LSTQTVKNSLVPFLAILGVATAKRGNKRGNKTGFSKQESSIGAGCSPSLEWFHTTKIMN